MVRGLTGFGFAAIAVVGLAMLGSLQQAVPLVLFLVAGLLLSRSDRVVRVLAMGQPLDELSLICEKIQPQAVVLFAQHVMWHKRRCPVHPSLAWAARRA